MKHRNFVARARDISILVFDVDGVLTDGTIYMGPDGLEGKGFYVRDGLAMVAARKVGIQLGIVTARQSAVVAKRAEELGVEHVYQAVKDKRAAVTAIAERAGVSLSSLAFMGDDLIDLPALCAVGLSAAPADAEDVVLQQVHYVARRPGGRGAVRDFCQDLLEAKGLWSEFVQGYLP